MTQFVSSPKVRWWVTNHIVIGNQQLVEHFFPIPLLAPFLSHQLVPKILHVSPLWHGGCLDHLGGIQLATLICHVKLQSCQLCGAGSGKVLMNVTGITSELGQTSAWWGLPPQECSQATKFDLDVLAPLFWPWYQVHCRLDYKPSFVPWHCFHLAQGYDAYPLL